MVVASENGTHVYAVAGFGERPGGKGKGGAPSPPPPLWYYRSNSTAFRHGRDAWFFFFFLFDSEGGRGESRRAVYGCESARGLGGERGGQVEWSLFPRGMTRCEGLHRDRGYTPVRRCVGYVRVYIYTRRARATKRRRRRRRRDRGEFPRGFFCALRKFVWRVA